MEENNQIILQKQYPMMSTMLSLNTKGDDLFSVIQKMGEKYI